MPFVLFSILHDVMGYGIVFGVFSSIGTLGKTLATILSGAVYNQLHHHAPYWGASLLGIALFFID